MAQINKAEPRAVQGYWFSWLLNCPTFRIPKSCKSATRRRNTALCAMCPTNSSLTTIVPQRNFVENHHRYWNTPFWLESLLHSKFLSDFHLKLRKKPQNYHFNVNWDPERITIKSLQHRRKRNQYWCTRKRERERKGFRETSCAFLCSITNFKLQKP